MKKTFLVSSKNVTFPLFSAYTEKRDILKNREKIVFASFDGSKKVFNFL